MYFNLSVTYKFHCYFYRCLDIIPTYKKVNIILAIDELFFWLLLKYAYDSIVDELISNTSSWCYFSEISKTQKNECMTTVWTYTLEWTTDFNRTLSNMINDNAVYSSPSWDQSEEPL